MSIIHPQREDHGRMMSRAARRGLALFVLYLALYAGFLVLDVCSPGALADTYLPIGAGLELDLQGLNLALVYGLGFILAAIVLAIYYMHLTRPPRRL